MRQSIEKLMWSDRPHNKADSISAIVGAVISTVSLIVLMNFGG